MLLLFALGTLQGREAEFLTILDFWVDSHKKGLELGLSLQRFILNIKQRLPLDEILNIIRFLTASWPYFTCSDWSGGGLRFGLIIFPAGGWLGVGMEALKVAVVVDCSDAVLLQLRPYVHCYGLG